MGMSTPAIRYDIYNQATYSDSSISRMSYVIHHSTISTYDLRTTDGTHWPLRYQTRARTQKKRQLLFDWASWFAWNVLHRACNISHYSVSCTRSRSISVKILDRWGARRMLYLLSVRIRIGAIRSVKVSNTSTSDPVSTPQHCNVQRTTQRSVDRLFGIRNMRFGDALSM